MKDYLKRDNWLIIEEGLDPHNQKISESIFSLGNGRFGQRANFEEDYSGETLQGNYVAGVYYPDKTRVGWWKNGYPDYFAKVLNAANWNGIRIRIGGIPLDLAKCEVRSFRRVLNMKHGYLERSFVARMQSGQEVEVKAIRFCSIADDETAAIRYSVKALNYGAPIEVTPYIDGDVVNQDANYDEKFWTEVAQHAGTDSGFVVAETRKTAFQVATAMKFALYLDGEEVSSNPYREEREKYAGCTLGFSMEEGQTLVIEKFVGIVSSLNYPKEKLAEAGQMAAARAFDTGFDLMWQQQASAWEAKWEEADIVIEGDVAAQQGIRFNIFQLYQTYTGEDERLNIGPKGFTGEKYGGSTYWDTEAYCFPFYMATADPHVARNLLVYRYKHLQKAIENAAKLGFKDGAALYPMVTMNGEESHNEWEITFEEIHRNGAIAYAIYDFVRYTGEKEYLIDKGLEVLIAIARFWAQRVHFSERRGKFVMHGVTGPNEYENNVNNNWYTNYIAVWCMRYTMEALDYVKTAAPEKFSDLEDRIRFHEYTETGKWKEICDNMYLPEDEKLGIFVQHDGFLDKELLTVDDLPASQRPINQKWSWDRILRSVFIKQADVLQGLYIFEDHFDTDIIRRNFDFYEPRTVHESSLSPCVHAILAAKLGKEEKAYEMYLRTARLDLDDYNNDTEDGCHITSMAGTWMSFVKGFGGMRVYHDTLHLHPFLPSRWEGYSFNIRFRGRFLNVQADREKVYVHNKSDQALQIVLFGKKLEVPSHGDLVVPAEVRKN